MRLMFLILLIPMSLLAQKNDYIWHLGTSNSDNPLDTNWGRSIIDFTKLSQPKIYYDGYGTQDFYGTNVSFSDRQDI